MGQYRKRAADVEAFSWTGNETWTDAPAWARDLATLGKIRFRDAATADDVVCLVDPPSGHGAPLVCTRGDWLVRNAKGEVFPMTPERFAAAYEAVSGV
jgi:hypothetical protein